MQLLYPWFLLGLGATIIPIIIHLLQLRKPQRVLFTNIAIIRDVELTTVRHRRVQQLLILLARILAISALVVAFCQPILPVRDEGRGAVSQSVAIWIDNSFSMQAPQAAGERLFDGAVGQAKILGQALGQSGNIRLKQAGRRTLSKDAYLDELANLRLSGKTIRANSGDNSEGSVYIFSDFQRNQFSAKNIEALAEGKQTLLVPMVAEPTGNVYVDSLWVEDAFVRMRTNVGMHIRVRNGGNAAVNDCPVKVYLGAKQVAAFRVAVEPGKSAVTVVQVQLADAGTALGRVVIEEQPVTFDNTYYFTLQPAAAIRVVEIGEEPATEQAYGNEPLFAYVFAKAGRVDFGVLKQANLVIVRELGGIDAGLREALGQVVRRGGSVVVVPTSGKTARNSYQALFKELGIGEAQWENGAAVPELREVAMPSGQEPFFRNVFGAQPRAVTMPRVAPVLRWARTGTDILRMRDGESYLAEFATGKGKAYVFSAPLARPYSDFAEHTLFVPVMYRLAMLSYRNEQLPAYRLTQPGLNLQLPEQSTVAKGAGSAADEAGIRLVKDSLVLIPGQRRQGNEVRLELPAGMDMPGFYQVRRGEKVLTTLAFNADKAESELAAYSADELRQLIGPNHPNIRVVESGADGAGLRALQAEQTGTPLWRYWVLLALLALLAEVLLVRFGRRGNGALARPAAAA
ncbi:BatA domain-containing protein [Hymenobacter armeniacus]|uniref:BatA domain-containing protein n=1 Tax=Hymenobacter armeniacus TaxID=2771358 RepID=A0ABR8JPF7_9BACT|nr:BatA domain-containing protein [Hymenobacter armeniacus]MBD2720490.1 BatA domain-containing protein [Hymenobacter armeniacus]